MLGLTKNEWKGLWAILWRVLLLGPFVGLLGLALLVLVISAFVAPLCFAFIAFLDERWLVGILWLIPWMVLLRFSRRIWRWLLEGIEYGGI